MSAQSEDWQREDFRAAMPLMSIRGHSAGDDDSDLMHTDEEEDPLESVLNRMKYRPQLTQSQEFWPPVLLSGSLCLVVGFVFSYIAFNVGQRSLIQKEHLLKLADPTLGASFSHLVATDRLKNFITELQEEDVTGAEHRLDSHFLGNGCDTSSIFNYSVLSFQPDPLHECKVSILDESSKELFSTTVNISSTFNTSLNDIQGKLVYVNSGIAVDFLELEKLGVPISGMIVMARTDKLLPEDIVQSAKLRKAAAVILFSPSQSDESLWYPYNDPATPKVPAINGTFSTLEFDDTYIPVVSMKYKDAQTILSLMMTDGEESWDQPGRASAGTVHLRVRSVPTINQIADVVAMIAGKQEPDRYVIVGAKRLKSGVASAALMELVRILGNLKATKGWRPRRSLVICSWGGEGAVGSSEWVEQFKNKLTGQTVAYLNLEEVLTPVPGSPSLVVYSSPLVIEALIQTYQQFLPNHTIPNLASNKLLPIPNRRGSCFGFIHNTGVPCVNLLLNSKAALTEATALWGTLTWLLADSTLLPLDVRNYASFVSFSLKQLHSKYDTMLKDHNLSLDGLDQAAARFAKSADHFHEHLSSATIHNDLQLRQINNQMHQLEGSFILPCTLSRESQNALLSASQTNDATEIQGFGLLQDLLNACSSPNHMAAHAQQLQVHVSQLSHLLNSAAMFLLPPTQLQ